MPIDLVTLLINGMVYGGWKEISIERGVDRCVSTFNLAVSERWAGQSQPWQIMPFSAVQVFVGADLMLTGYVAAYVPSWDPKSHGVRVTGHSKTIDLVQCNPDIKSGQFSGFTVAAIARSICALFGINVVVQTDLANQVVENTNLQRSETAFAFLERLGRLSGVLMCDDPNGNLVLATAGSVKASSTLVQGQNIMSANAMINVDKRHSIYIVKGQASIGHGATPTYNGLGGISAPAAPTGAVQTQMRATATDSDVPRYRPKVTLGESQLTLAQMRARANWQKQFAYGQATKATIIVPGFRQADGTLWTINQIVACTVPWLEIDADLLVAKVKFSLDEKASGHRTELMLGPVEGYTPDPGEVKLHKGKKGGKGKGGGINWSGLGGRDGVS